MTSVAFHIDQALFPVSGGIGTVIRELVPAMRAADPELELVLFHAMLEGTRQEAWMDGLRRVELPLSIRRLYPGWNLTGRPSLPPELARLDLVHAPAPAAIPPPGPGQPLVVTVHDLAFRHYPRLFPRTWRLLYRLGTRRAARRADAVIVPSQSTARDLVRLEGADPTRVHVVPLAASLPESRLEPDEALRRLRVAAPYVLFVGTLEPRKNLVRLVRAYRRAVTRAGLPHRLILVGPLGWGAQALHRELALPGPGEIHLAGRVSADELDALYRGAEIFVYPSLYEGFGLPPLEAMARGVPTIVSAVSSMPEVAGESALTVDPRSVIHLADTIERLLTDRLERERLAEAGRKRASEYSWDRTARGTLAVYRSLL